MGGLGEHLRRRIALHGPLTVAEYMAEVLADPRHGYYMKGDPFGAAGDFTTAPEINQMFGELIGLWCAVVWRLMGEPRAVNLVELGPGRGTLLADLLRAAKTEPEFGAAVRLHLVETSPPLRARQRQALEVAGLADGPVWYDAFAEVPEGPLLLVANEFFDALPIRQFARTDLGWRERLVDFDEASARLRFVLSAPGGPSPLMPPSLREAPPGSMIEVCPAALSLAHEVARRLAGCGGAALIVDYGHPESAAGDTLQAVKRHAFHDPLAEPGTADLTAHVDFAALARAAAEAGAASFGPLAQGVFFERLGIAARARALQARATPRQAHDLAAAYRRLVDPAEMGALFKVLALTHPTLPAPPGFE